MKKIIPLHIKLLLIILGLLFVLLLNPFGQKQRGKLQNDFDSWLSASKDSLVHPSEGRVFSLKVILRSQAPGRVFSWELESTENAELNERIVRLLRQAQEAGLFEFDKDRPAEMTLEVKDDKNTFVSRFNEADVQRNVKAVIFLQLFEEFSKDRQNINPASHGAS